MATNELYTNGATAKMNATRRSCPASVVSRNGTPNICAVSVWQVGGEQRFYIEGITASRKAEVGGFWSLTIEEMRGLHKAIGEVIAKADAMQAEDMNADEHSKGGTK